MSLSFLALKGFTALAFVWWARTAMWLLKAKRFPPGPPRHLVMDNRKDMAFGTLASWKSIHQWHKAYGPVVSFYLGRRLFVSLGSVEATTALFEKRGGLYSSRPRSIVANEILSGGMRGLSMPYGQRFRNWRSLLQTSLNIQASTGYQHLQATESKLVLKDLLEQRDDPKQFAAIFRRYMTSIMTMVCYGRRVSTLDDHLVVEQAVMEEHLHRASAPGKHLVEMFPILLWIPKPLQWFRHEFEARFKVESQLVLDLLNEVRERRRSGTAAPCTATRGLEKQKDYDMNDLQLAYASMSPFGAGAGTSLATIDWFIVAMLHYPETMRKAQEEIDRVVGADRLPDFDDASSLPYIDAIIKETMRWRPIAPLGVPHSVIEDDVYNGYLIAKDATVLGNVYSIAQDEEMFPDPDTFRPERYLDDPSLPHTFVFGFGRRLCPGLHIARNSLYILISRMLWGFDIVAPKDAKGVPVLPSKDDLVASIVAKPKPFDYLLVPRRHQTASVILSEAEQAIPELAGYN